ncbi:MAG: hypothetical protein HYY84_08135 [Deltaproteobacteria bacterium]|nr:hypothetical protein [Deltaproteobacteria bacterium]
MKKFAVGLIAVFVGGSVMPHRVTAESKWSTHDLIAEVWKPIIENDLWFAFEMMSARYDKLKTDESRRAFYMLMHDALVKKVDHMIEKIGAQRFKFYERTQGSQNEAYRDKVLDDYTRVQKELSVRRREILDIGYLPPAMFAIGISALRLKDKSVHQYWGTEAINIGGDKIVDQAKAKHGVLYALSQSGKATFAATANFFNEAMKAVGGDTWDKLAGNSLRDSVLEYCETVGLERDYAENVVKYSAAAGYVWGQAMEVILTRKGGAGSNLAAAVSKVEKVADVADKAQKVVSAVGFLKDSKAHLELAVKFLLKTPEAWDKIAKEKDTEKQIVMGILFAFDLIQKTVAKKWLKNLVFGAHVKKLIAKLEDESRFDVAAKARMDKPNLSRRELRKEVRSQMAETKKRLKELKKNDKTSWGTTGKSRGAKFLQALLLNTLTELISQFLKAAEGWLLYEGVKESEEATKAWSALDAAFRDGKFIEDVLVSTAKDVVVDYLGLSDGPALVVEPVKEAVGKGLKELIKEIRE